MIHEIHVYRKQELGKKKKYSLELRNEENFVSGDYTYKNSEKQIWLSTSLCFLKSC